MGKQKILFISQEIAPYLPESALSLFGRKLPQTTQENGFEVRTFMPKYGCINERRNQLHEVIRLSGMNVIIDDSDHPLIIKVATLQPTRMQVYFIDNDDYFHFSPDKQLETVASPADNDERQMFFVRGVIETVKKLRWEPAVIHCMGWISALVPLYVKRMFQDDPSVANAKVVFDLRPEKFEGTLAERFAEKLKLNQFSDADISALGNSPVTYEALTRLAIDYADAVVQTSPDVDPALVDYARESGKPFLPYDNALESQQDMAPAVVEFYKTLIEE
ncbi:MAG: glycogen/starch synthase [Firmicutes bacterium]|nr:glycogen/starch synthase [Bacillota bacterium]MCM1401998.1 glycogen/starch synthase [Bacteroides sp.]MCM1476897.1 glycogen/starch synthase [Bacteroides sp.]